MKEKINKNNSIEMEELSILDPSVINPSEEFVNNLENKVINVFNHKKPSNNFLNKLLMDTKKKWLIVGSLSLLLVSGLAGMGTLYFTNKNNNNLLAEIARKNPNVDVSTKLFEGSRAESNDSAMALDMMWYEPGYTYSKVEYTPGNAENKCLGMSSGYGNGLEGVSYISENKSFYDDNNNYNLSIVKTSDGKILSYYLSTNDSYYEFHGGDYAVHQKYSVKNMLMDAREVGYDENEALIGDKEVSSEEEVPQEGIVVDGSETGSDGETSTGSGEDSDGPAVTEPKPDEGEYEKPGEDVEVSNEDLITQYFGEGAKIIKKEDYEGKKAYLIESKINAYCDISDKARLYIEKDMAVSSYTDIDENTEVIIQRLWVEAESFMNLERSYYYGSYSNVNLIGTEKYEYLHEDVAFNEVKNEFVFLSGVTVKEIEEYDYDITDESNKWVKDNKVLILVPSDNTGLSMNSVYSQDAYDAQNYDYFRYDRKFYPAGEIGDKLFDMNQPIDDDYISSKLNYGLSKYDENNSRYYDFQYYKGEKLADIVNQSKHEKTDTAVDGEVTIDGNKVTAKIVKVEERSYVSEPSSDGDVVAPDQAKETEIIEYRYMYFFDYKGFVVYVYSQDEKLDLESLDFNNTSDYAKYQEMLEIVQYPDEPVMLMEEAL